MNVTKSGSKARHKTNGKTSGSKGLSKRTNLFVRFVVCNKIVCVHNSFHIETEPQTSQHEGVIKHMLNE